MSIQNWVVLGMFLYSNIPIIFIYPNLQLDFLFHLFITQLKIKVNQ